MAKKLVKNYVIKVSICEFQHVENSLSRNFAKNSMLILQFLSGAQSEEKLGSIVISARVGHRHQASPAEAQSRVELIFEGLAPNGLTALAGARGVTTLGDELLDHPMENGAIIVALHAELYEIATCFWCLLWP